MKIHADMSLDELEPLMGNRVGRPDSERFASKEEAEELRALLVHRFLGKDTADIDRITWHELCCSVDPFVAALNVPRFDEYDVQEWTSRMYESADIRDTSWKRWAPCPLRGRPLRNHASEQKRILR